MIGALERGREAFQEQAWSDASTFLLAADREGGLAPVDLERLAIALYLVGRDADSAEVWTRAHHGWLRSGEAARAARCAFWRGFGHDITGEQAQAAGWFERARRLVDEAALDCVEQGYVLVPGAMRSLMVTGDAVAARAGFARVAAVGDRFGDADLGTLGRLGEGHARVLLGDRPGGVAMLDEAMVAVTAGEVSPQLAGLVYCAVIEICQETFDLRRARDWTEALTRWCASQPDLEPYRGNCLVHRAEILQLDGAWAEAMTEVELAFERLSSPPGQWAVGAACYQRAELHRLLGEFAAAEDAYRQASHWGRPPQPGLALLRLAQGRVGQAQASIDRAVTETPERLARARLLAAQAEIALAAGDVGAAGAAAGELAAIADAVGMPYLMAVAGHATGSVRLAEGDARGALAAARAAHDVWQTLGAPYEAARSRVVVGRCCQALDDQDGAALELGAAEAAFVQLGAEPDVAAVRAVLADVGGVTADVEAGGTGGLSRRERQVLGRVATGRTNREIAADLVISEKTVARHLSNIFGKLGVSSRSAATAYAYEHDLVELPHG